MFDLAAEAAVYEADDVLYTAAGKLADLESYDDVPDYATVLRAAHEGVTWVRDTAKVRLEASAQAGGDVPVSGDTGTRNYKNLAKPVMVDGDALVAVRPDPESGRRFMRVLRDRFRDRGIECEWMMWMLSDETGVSLIWMRSRYPDPG